MTSATRLAMTPATSSAAPSILQHATAGDTPSPRPAALATAPIGILLAAGFGTRFDPTGVRNKLLAELPCGPEAGLPVAFAAANRACQALSRVLAVTRGDSPALAVWLARAGCELVEAPLARDGMGFALAAGVQASLRAAADGSAMGGMRGATRDEMSSSPSGNPSRNPSSNPSGNRAGDDYYARAAAPAGWVVLLADMPAIEPATIRKVAAALSRADTSPECIVAPAFEGTRGHPVGFGPAHGAALQALTGDTGARGLLARYPVTLLQCGDPGVLRDIDRFADLKAGSADRL